MISIYSLLLIPSLGFSGRTFKSPSRTRLSAVAMSANVQFGDIPHINDAETEPWATGHGAIHQALYQ
jgi:hypothetical protein